GLEMQSPSEARHRRAELALATVCTAFQRCRATVAINPDAKKVVADMVGRDGAWLTAKTLSEHARRIGVPDGTLACKAELTAAAAWIAYVYSMRDQIRKIADDTIRADGILHTLYTFIRFDETPLRLTVVDKNVFFGLPQDVIDEVAGFFSERHEARDAGVAKLLQIEVE
ncbi:unnamed protein product, partial [Prorocentrum cordatum]